MKRSLFPVFVGLCSLLLGSPGARCFSVGKRDVFTIPEIKEELGDIGTNSTVTPKPFIETSLTVTEPPLNKDVVNRTRNGTSLENILSVEEKPQSSQTSEVNSPILIIHDNSNGQDNTTVEKLILTTSVSTEDYITRITSLGDTTELDLSKHDQEVGGKDTKLEESNLENPPQVNTVEMLTTNPRTSSTKVVDDMSTVPLAFVDQPGQATLDSLLKEETVPEEISVTSVNVENAVSLNIPYDLESATAISKETNFTVPWASEEWDDTKLTTQISLTLNTQNDITPAHDTTTHTTDGSPESGISSLFNTSPGVDVQGDTDFIVNIPTEQIPTDHSGPAAPTADDSTTMEQNSSPSKQIIDSATSSSQELSASEQGVKQEVSEVAVHRDATPSAAVFMDVTTKENSQKLDSSNNDDEPTSEDPLPGSSTPPLEVVKNTDDADSSYYVSSAGMPVVEVTTAVLIMADTDKDKAMTVGTVTSAPLTSQTNVLAPPARRVSSTEADGLEKQDSEETAEEDEDEEDDDEDDGDEDEEEDDDKYTDSLNESVEGDSYMAQFTLPGLPSQEPLEDKNNVVLVDGAAYQVPDSQEWEQQNQGLVRSWMEKLKDKAGYMSGMLAPVGVGIGGALSILGVLYGIKFMNRRRRNGIKQHKRKREFNSMQDRVMLLADSSEDEF
ncbi:armadillo-like helical domain-containing protein 4 isoform X2 [Spea bombifrons]|uniref:armadillo-like helical domain-containing protein 4 isoform X2 n=1 Tax=Spea bombifrons TaxID=233779 RepID=UPI00234A41BB|nr:armadillo-like helical domain-containing protein 4 isoform X2 [Spea bombifrons]